MATLKTLLVKLGMDTKQFKSGVNRALTGLEQLAAGAQKLSSVGKGTSLALLAGQAVNLGAALAPAAGALLALPAAMAAVKVASATAKIAVAGVGEAMAAAAEGDAKKLAEAMKELSPAARSFVTAAAAIKKQGLDPIQKAVQQRFFEGLTGPLKAAATSVLPTAKAGMTEVSGALNSMATEALRVAATPMFKGEMAKVFGNTAGVLNTLRDGVEPLITSVLKLANAGAPLMQRMAGWAVEGLKSGAAFLTSEQGAAKLAGVVDRAGNTLATLGTIVKNVGVGLAGIFKGASTDGASLLGTIESLTARFAAWAQSAQGQQQIGNVFQLLAQTGAALGPVLSMLSGPLTTLASIITSMPPGVQEVVAKFLAFSIIAGAIAGKVGPAITGLRLLATGIGNIPGAVAKIGPAATAIGAFGTKLAATAATAAAAAGRMVLSMATAAAGMVASAATMVATMAMTAGRVVAGWVLMGAQALAQAARVALAWVIAMGPIGLIIAAVVALVALIVANWDTIREAIGAAWEWVSSKTSEVWNSIVSFLTGLWEGIKSTAAAVWQWIKDKISGFVSGAIAIFQNFTLPGLIAKHWETIKAAAQTAWNWVVTQIKTAVTNVIAGVQALAELPGKVKQWFLELVQGAINKAVELVTWAKQFPPKIVAGLGNLATLLLQAGKDLILGLINGVKAMASQAIDAAKNVIKGATDAVTGFLDSHSPSRLYQSIGVNTIQGWIDGVLSKGGAAVAAAKKVMKNASKAAMAESFGDNRAAIDEAISAAERKAAQQKTEILGATSGTAGVAFNGPTYGGGGAAAAGGGGTVVNVDLSGSVIREEADVPRLARQFGYELAVQA